MPDRVQRLREAAQARHDATLRRAENALRRLAKTGDPVTFRRVAEEAGVSRVLALPPRPVPPRRSTSYATPQPAGPAACPAAERATVDSLRQQLRTYRERDHPAPHREPGTPRATRPPPRRRNAPPPSPPHSDPVDDMSTNASPHATQGNPRVRYKSNQSGNHAAHSGMTERPPTVGARTDYRSRLAYELQVRAGIAPIPRERRVMLCRLVPRVLPLGCRPVVGGGQPGGRAPIRQLEAGSRHAVSTWLKEESDHAHACDCLRPGVARGSGAHAVEGEGVHPGARCAGGRTPAHAVDGRGEGLPLRRADR